ncbi:MULTISPECIES: phosphoserine phosphatase SerB [unclassified Pseudoalteromonas]|uniref:phosphoserine phosphatase SerB n=1 Tax=unclassified Pseudoalteromonas TaxID=194690 RepID=UPI0030151F49
MSLVSPLTPSGKAQPLEKLLPLGRWFQYEGNTSFSAVNSSPQEYSQFITIFGAQFTSEHALQLEQFLAQQHINDFYLCAYQPVANLAVALAVALPSELELDKAAVKQFAQSCGAQGALLQSPPQLSKPGLLVMDMDSTAIEIECIDEIARLAGRFDEVAAVTAEAMAGNLSFAASLHQRVASLSSVSLEQIQGLKDNLPLMAGIVELCQVLKQHQWRLALASGGFTWFAEALIEPLGLDAVYANTLEVEQGKLTGRVIGDIVDAEKKAQVVAALAQQYAIAPEQTVAIGDGANDLLMMAEAQLGVAVHGKPKVVAAADTAICSGSLLQLVYLLSIPR